MIFRYLQDTASGTGLKPQSVSQEDCVTRLQRSRTGDSKSFFIEAFKFIGSFDCRRHAPRVRVARAPSYEQNNKEDKHPVYTCGVESPPSDTTPLRVCTTFTPKCAIIKKSSRHELHLVKHQTACSVYPKQMNLEWVQVYSFKWK